MVEGQNRLQILKTCPLTFIYTLWLTHTGTYTQACTQNNKMKKTLQTLGVCMSVSLISIFQVIDQLLDTSLFYKI